MHSSFLQITFFINDLTESFFCVRPYLPRVQDVLSKTCLTHRGKLSDFHQIIECLCILFIGSYILSLNMSSSLDSYYFLPFIVNKPIVEQLLVFFTWPVRSLASLWNCWGASVHQIIQVEPELEYELYTHLVGNTWLKISSSDYEGLFMFVPNQYITPSFWEDYQHLQKVRKELGISLSYDVSNEDPPYPEKWVFNLEQTNIVEIILFAYGILRYLEECASKSNTPLEDVWTVSNKYYCMYVQLCNHMPFARVASWFCWWRLREKMLHVCIILLLVILRSVLLQYPPLIVLLYLLFGLCCFYVLYKWYEEGSAYVVPLLKRFGVALGVLVVLLATYPSLVITVGLLTSSFYLIATLVYLLKLVDPRYVTITYAEKFNNPKKIIQQKPNEMPDQTDPGVD